MPPTTVRRDRRLVRLVALHLVLWASWIAWRLLEITPATSTLRGSTFTASPWGRALAMVTVLGGVAAIVGLVATTFQLRRRPMALVLFAASCAAVARRGSPDVFDVAYLLCVPCAAAWVLVGQRLQSQTT